MLDALKSDTCHPVKFHLLRTSTGPTDVIGCQHQRIISIESYFLSEGSRAPNSAYTDILTVFWDIPGAREHHPIEPGT